jgi:hypothetical protein
VAGATTGAGCATAFVGDQKAFSFWRLAIGFWSED